MPFDINADKDSNEYLMALVVNEFPGSWLPYGKEQIIKNAEPYFKLVTLHSGKLDYIETIKVWRQRLKRFGLQKYLAYLSLTPRFLVDPKMRNRFKICKLRPSAWLSRRASGTISASCSRSGKANQWS
jgi:cyclopropane-fatty-acyl-phospholipid synthase